MVTVAVPVAALLLAVSVSVLVVGAVAEVGLNVAVTPLGMPDAEKLTLPVKPFCGVTVMVLVPLFPWMNVKLLGDADRPKLGTEAEFTVRLTVVV